MQLDERNLWFFFYGFRSIMVVYSIRKGFPFWFFFITEAALIIRRFDMNSNNHTTKNRLKDIFTMIGQPKEFDELYASIKKAGQEKDDVIYYSDILKNTSGGVYKTLTCMMDNRELDTDLRLFAVRCARSVEKYIPEKFKTNVLDTVEKFIKGECPVESMEKAQEDAIAALDAYEGMPGKGKEFERNALASVVAATKLIPAQAAMDSSYFSLEAICQHSIVNIKTNRNELYMAKLEEVQKERKEYIMETFFREDQPVLNDEPDSSGTSLNNMDI